MPGYGGIVSKDGGPLTEQEEAVHEFMQYLRGGGQNPLQAMMENEGLEDEEEEEEELPEGMEGLDDHAKL